MKCRQHTVCAPPQDRHARQYFPDYASACPGSRILGAFRRRLTAQLPDRRHAVLRCRGLCDPAYPECPTIADLLSHMKIDDPFGRNARKQEQNYASVRKALQAAGITTPALAEQCLQGITRKALIASAVLAALVAAAALLYPQLLPAALVCAGVGGLWISVTAINGRRHVLRYREEEFRD